MRVASGRARDPSKPPTAAEDDDDDVVAAAAFRPLVGLVLLPLLLLLLLLLLLMDACVPATFPPLNGAKAADPKVPSKASRNKRVSLELRYGMTTFVEDEDEDEDEDCCCCCCRCLIAVRHRMRFIRDVLICEASLTRRALPFCFKEMALCQSRVE